MRRASSRTRSRAASRCTFVHTFRPSALEMAWVVGGPSYASTNSSMMGQSSQHFS